VIRFVEYKLKCQLLFDHSKFCFIREKHLVKSDSVPKKLRGCPISGRIDSIPVRGDFCEMYNILKEKPAVYTIGKENGTATAFASFCQMMVVSGWLRHDDVIVMDNAAIHTGGESADLEQFFWKATIDGRDHCTLW
jgi:hypothetical protein